VKRIAGIFGLLLGAAGCAPWLAGPADYAAYRRTRIAPTLEARLTAADAYLNRFPDGAFHEPVKAYFDRAERVFFNAKQSTVAGLEAYLRTLPKGPHGSYAEARLTAFRAAKAAREASIGVEEVTTKLDLAEADRQHARKALAAWIGHFLDASLWKAPMSQAKAELIVSWALAPPKPSCRSPEGDAGRELPERASRRCTKLLELPYSVRVNGVNDPRQATVEIIVIQDAEGRPLMASIGGPDLFLRLEEMFTIRAIEPGDGERRVAAIGRAVELVKGEFTRAVSVEPSCKRPVSAGSPVGGPPVAPVFLHLACEGVEVTARAGISPGEDDVVVVRPQK